MQRQDFWYKPEAQSLGAIPTGTRVGQFLFLSSQAAIDLETGKRVRGLADLPEQVRGEVSTGQSFLDAYFGATMAQTWAIYRNIRNILALQGASLEDIVRQRIYLRDIRDVGWMERVMLSFFPTEKPVTLILGVSDKGIQKDIRLWIDVIALVPQKDGLQKQTIYLSELEKVTGPYPQAMKVGQLMFFDGLMGIDPREGHPVTRFDELDPEVRSGIEGLYVDAAAEAMKCQWWLTYNGHIRKLLESQGSGLHNLLDVNGYRRSGMRACAEQEYMRSKLFKTARDAPPSTGFGVYNLSIIPDVEILTGGVALLPGEHQKQSLRYSEGVARAITLAGMTKAGPFWFVCGLTPFNFEKQQPVLSFDDLADHGRFFAESHIDAGQDILAKAWYVYNSILDNVDAKVDEVIQQTVFLRDLRDWRGVERVARTVFKGHIPPTTLVPVDEVAFDERFEIQLWGYANRE